MIEKLKLKYYNKSNNKFLKFINTKEKNFNILKYQFIFGFFWFKLCLFIIKYYLSIIFLKKSVNISSNFFLYLIKILKK